MSDTRTKDFNYQNGANDAINGELGQHGDINNSDYIFGYETTKSEMEDFPGNFK